LKTLIIYESVHHGNTEKIAKVIANVLEAKLVRPKELDINTVAECDLIGFGSGIYMGRHHKSLLNIVDKLSSQKNKEAFIFSTSGAGEKNIDKNHKLIKEKLMGIGFTIIGEFSCKGFSTVGPLKLFGGINKGRPNEHDLENARKFASSVKLHRGESMQGTQPDNCSTSSY